jgi:RNA polymerase sigma factor (sigma-70 family)
VKENRIVPNETTRDTPPPLSASEEAALCRRWHEHHDVAAAERLVGSHLQMVAGIAMAHRGYGVLTQELIGEGYVGLMQAACRYDPSCGTRFASYATCWVRAAIQQSILRASPAMHADEADGETIDSRPLLHARGSEQRASVHFI